MAGIFISYRREDSAGYAMLLRDRLEAEFGAIHQIFLDVDAIEPGDDFVETIERKIASSRVLVAVIGKNWLAAKRDAARRDYVHFEIQMALDRKIRVIPALVAGGRMPRAEDLPPALARFAHCHGLEISDAGVDHGIQRLIDALKKALPATRKTGVSSNSSYHEPPRPLEELLKLEPVPAAQLKKRDGPDGLPYVWIPYAGRLMERPPSGPLQDPWLHGFIRPTYDEPITRQGFWISEIFVTNRDYLRVTGVMPGAGSSELLLPAQLRYWEVNEYCRKIGLRAPASAELQLAPKLEAGITYVWTSDSVYIDMTTGFLRPILDD